MHLFDKIPENLFSILASKNKRIYLDVLFVVQEGFKYELTLSRSNLVAMLISKMESEIYDLVSEGEENTDIDNFDLSARANFLIRKLVETKWLIQEMNDKDFENMISLPDYASTILDVLGQLMEQKTAEYNGRVVSSYNNLKAADIERGEYVFHALNHALIDTEQLIDLLKKQYHNIGRYHQIAIELANINELLSSHFDDFHDAIVTQFLLPFKTFDSVPRFKGPILEILNRWYQDETFIEILGEQAVRYGHVKESSEAGMTIISMISRIIDLYENLPVLMQEIDLKHNAYTRASIEKIQYLLNRDQSIKGKLVKVIQSLSSEQLKQDDINKEIALFRQNYVDQGSLYARSKMKKNRQIKSKPVEIIQAEFVDGATKRFLAMVKEAYGREAVLREMDGLLENGSIDTSQMPLGSTKDLARIMLAALYGIQPQTSFETEFRNERFENDNYEVPNNSFHKKEGQS
ncbi:MAG: DUF5716 family protein [Clostridiales bacterium]|nr:DUF5716 family protein [Clostridiales bacterium]